MSDFVLDIPVTALALFGPSGSGKSTFIEALFERFPGKFVQPYIVTTRPPRRTEKPEQRRFVSRNEFEKELAQGEMCYASEHYGHWHGTRKAHLRKLAEMGGCLVMDPNQFPRLAMLERLFCRGKLVVVHFVPISLIEINRLSDSELTAVFEARMGARGDVSNEEFRLRLEEAAQTMRECCRRPLTNVFVNDFAKPFEERFEEFIGMFSSEIPGFADGPALGGF